MDSALRAPIEIAIEALFIYCARYDHYGRAMEHGKHKRHRRAHHTESGTRYPPVQIPQLVLALRRVVRLV